MSNVIIKTRSDCSFCKDAKGFLTGMEISFKEEYQPTGRVPQIFINGNNIGGYDDLVKLSMSSKWTEYFKG